MIVREIEKEELDKLIDLYQHLHPGEDTASENDLKICWESIRANSLIKYFVIEKEGIFVASCNVSVLPNLTRGAKSIALIENVVTHSRFRGMGYGKKIMTHAINFAKQERCYKVMLMSNVKRIKSHQFYKSLGFSSEDKVGFVYHL